MHACMQGSRLKVPFTDQQKKEIWNVHHWAQKAAPIPDPNFPCNLAQLGGKWFDVATLCITQALDEQCMVVSVLTCEGWG